MKIGYQAGLKLLRSGAELIVTTRFPRDSAARYAREADFGEWAHRLEIFGLDLRHTPSVEAFCRELLATRGRLDFIINNACQTVRRPPAFYAHMMAGETAPALGDMPERVRMLPVHAATLSQVPLLSEELATQSDLFPEGQLDQDLQQVDLRGRNSWRLLLAEVSTVEMLEVQLVNAIAPFVINARLKALMLRTPERDKHIVNVSAVEGQFYRSFKTIRHPHTNMAKAALNMMTRTAAADYHSRRHPHEQRRHRMGHRRGPGRDRGAEVCRAALSSAARQRGRRRTHRRSHRDRREHGAARMGTIPEGLSAERLVGRPS